MADPRRRMKFSKITKSVQNVHLRVFEVADFEFIVIFTKFNMANDILEKYCSQIKLLSEQ